MKPVEQYRRQQRSSVFNGLLLFNLVIVLLQLWLFVSVFENLLGGKPAMAIPAGIASLVCLAINVWMLTGIQAMEKRP